MAIIFRENKLIFLARDLSLKSKIFMPIFVIVILFLIFKIFFFNSINSNISNLNNSLQQGEALRNQLQSKLDELQKLDKENEFLISNVNQKWKVEKHIKVILENLEKKNLRFLDLEEINLPTKAKDKIYSKKLFSLKAEGSFDSLFSFFDYLASKSSFLKVKQVVIKRMDSGFLKVEILFRVIDFIDFAKL
ncbi:TPA: hypothetical protein DEO28_00025 [Candidatus Dependentiae bacterium]|nr:MAG: hypothetical protein UR14_C0001G0136 [candidate division TM6 bacterium GW2011_GWE2_31_21]KKP53984.1 MAG: hypothetical protein UR43_C0001G0002 [candidate division TM6 bacterium GW2011_GWF2_33_332]HBS48435.1 hypothetical protein [Candidatus Dependentiae bacterium]HBZ72891.1 hypothetical protein [Candidatus Dependentiae bacterium]